MSKTEIKLPFGINGANRIVHINDVERGGACDCTCPGCGAPLLAAKGTVQQHHFKHAVEVECEGALESGIHLAAKQMIIEQQQLTLPQYAVCASRSDSKGVVLRVSEELIPARTVRRFDSVAAEIEVHGMRADILAMVGDRPLMVEVRYRHPVDDEKRAKIVAANISAVEIDLSDVSVDDSDRSSLWSRINDPARLLWLHNAREREASALLEKRLSALIAAREKEYEQEERELRERKRREKQRLQTALADMTALSGPEHLEQMGRQAEYHHVWQYHKQFLPFTWNELPPFLNVAVSNGDWIYGCDRRLWQLAFYSFFILKNGKPFTVRAVDNWLQLTVGLKVPSCVKTIGWYGRDYPEILPRNDFAPGTWNTLRAYFRVLCDLGILAYSGPDRGTPGNYWYSVQRAEATASVGMPQSVPPSSLTSYPRLRRSSRL